MKRFCLFLFFGVCVAITPVLADARLETMKSIYAGEMDKIVGQHVTDMKQVQKAYLVHLDNELKNTTNKGDLEAYKKIEQEKQRFQDEKTIPADSAVQGLIDNVELRKNSAVLALSNRYLAGLNNHKIALMKAKNIEGAGAVQNEAKKVEAVLADLASKVPTKPVAGRATGAAASTGGAKVLPLDLRKGLVLWYGFDEDDGEKVTDSSGKGNHGEGNGNWVQNARGLKNGAYRFDGDDEDIDIGSKVKLELPMSTAVWVKIEGFDKPVDIFMNDEFILAKHYAGVSIGCQSRTGRLYARMGARALSGNGRREKTAAEGSLSAGEWHHVAAVWEAHDKIQLFLDGEARDGTYQGGATKLLYSDKNGRVGGNFRGFVDDLLVYDRALSEAEVKKLYKAQGGK